MILRKRKKCSRSTSVRNDNAARLKIFFKSLVILLQMHEKFPAMKNCRNKFKKKKKKTRSQHTVFVTPHFMYKIGIFMIILG